MHFLQSSFVLFSHRPVLDAIVLSLTVAVFCFSFNFLGSWCIQIRKAELGPKHPLSVRTELLFQDTQKGIPPAQLWTGSAGSQTQEGSTAVANEAPGANSRGSSAKAVCAPGGLLEFGGLCGDFEGGSVRGAEGKTKAKPETAVWVNSLCIPGVAGGDENDFDASLKKMRLQTKNRPLHRDQLPMNALADEESVMISEYGEADIGSSKGRKKRDASANLLPIDESSESLSNDEGKSKRKRGLMLFRPFRKQRDGQQGIEDADKEIDIMMKNPEEHLKELYEVGASHLEVCYTAFVPCVQSRGFLSFFS